MSGWLGSSIEYEKSRSTAAGPLAPAWPTLERPSLPPLLPPLNSLPLWPLQPETWSEAQLLNILTGNFCMPRCEEPWYEARFENPKEGQAQVIVTELQKLGAKPTAKLADLGAPEQVRRDAGGAGGCVWVGVSVGG